MDWLRQKDNPYFAQAFVNRVWANYFNVGIVEPPDDLSLANPPSNKPLLDYLAERLRRPRLRHEVAASRDLQQPHVSAHLAAERNERQGRAELRPRGAAALAGGSGRRCDRRWRSRRTRRPRPIVTSLKGRAIAVAGSSARANARRQRPERGLRPAGLRPQHSREQLRLRPLDGSQPAADGLSAERHDRAAQLSKAARIRGSAQIAKQSPDKLTDGTRTDKLERRPRDLRG